MNVWGVNFHLWRQDLCSVLSRLIRQVNHLMFSSSSLLDSQGCQLSPDLTEMLNSSRGWMSLFRAFHFLCCHCGGYRWVVSRNHALCHFKGEILGSFWAGKSLIQCHTYIFVPVTYYSHLHVGRKQILENILWSSTHWSAWNLSSVLQLKGRRSRNIIYTIFKKKPKTTKKPKHNREEEKTLLPPVLIIAV